MHAKATGWDGYASLMNPVGEEGVQYQASDLSDQVLHKPPLTPWFDGSPFLDRSVLSGLEQAMGQADGGMHREHPACHRSTAWSGAYC